MNVINKHIRLNVFQNRQIFIYFSSLSFPVTGFNWSSEPKKATAVKESGATSVKPASWTQKNGILCKLPTEHNFMSSAVFFASTTIFRLLK